MSADSQPTITVKFEDNCDVTLILTSDQVSEDRDEILRRRADKAGAPHEAKSSSETIQVDLPPVEELVPGHDIRIKVAAAVLVRKSPVFRTWLQEGSWHGKRLKEDGFVELTDEDISPVALVHILNFFYDNYDEVPGFGLAQPPLAFSEWVDALVIIDKWDLHKSTTLLKRHWWAQFQGRIPLSIDDYMTKCKTNAETADLRACISAAHIMGKKAELEHLLRIYKLCTTGYSAADYDLPLPERLLMADRQRLQAVDALNKVLSDYFDSARQFTPTSICHCNKLNLARECDRHTLEHLAKAFRRLGWLDTKKRTKAVPGRHVPIQLDPAKIVLQDLRTRLPRMRSIPHHCMVTKIADEKRALEQKQVEQQAQLQALQTLHAFPLAHQAQQSFADLHPSASAFQTSASAFARSRPVAAPRQRPAARTTASQQPRRAVHPQQSGTQFQQVTGQQPFQNFLPSFSQIAPINAVQWPMTVFSFQGQSASVPPQPFFQNPPLPPQMLLPLHTTQPPPYHNPALAFPPDDWTRSPTMLDATMGLDFDSSTDTFLFGDSTSFDSAIDELFNLNDGSGQSVSSPINVDSYSSTKHPQPEPEPTVPCNPSPYQRIITKLRDVENDLLQDVPAYEPPIFLDDE